MTAMAGIDAGTAQQRAVAGRATITQVFRIATISSVQILVLVIAGTSGFIVSLLGLIIPDTLRHKPATTSRPDSRARSYRTASPSSSRIPSSPPSIHSSSARPKEAENVHSQASSNGDNHVRAWPMTRSNSDTSASSVVPDLGASSGSTSTSCSSSISDAQDKHHHTLHHHSILNPSALYEGIASRCKARRACKKHHNIHDHSSKGNEKSVSRSASIGTSSPRASTDGVRGRLASLIIPHGHSHHTTIDGRRSSHHAVGESGQISPASPELPSRSATAPDAASTTSVDAAVATVSKSAAATDHANTVAHRPPFLTRIFTFSSASSGSSTGEYRSSSSSSFGSKQSLAGISTSEAAVPSEPRLRARRLSTRLVSFRTTSSSHRGRNRTASEAAASGSMNMVTGELEAQSEGQAATSPPQTPRLGSLPSSSWTPGSNASPLRSPLAKRSFFGIGSSTSSSPSKTMASPGNTLTPRPSASQVQSSSRPTASPTGKGQRPGLGRRSASDNHSSWKSWVSASPGKIERRGTVSVAALQHDSAAASTTAIGHGRPERGSHNTQSRHARHVSDHAVLPSVREGRALPVAAPSSQSHHQQQQQRPRQNPQYRALSYAPPPSHAVLVPITASHGSINSRGAHVHLKRQEQRVFVPFHPFSDEGYKQTPLDLSGTSELTMEVHFSDLAPSSRDAVQSSST